MADQIYDGFISYSHAADGLLAPRLQAGLQRFAKPWWKRRAVRIFRDESSLSANPHLWSSITEALDTSGWFVLLLSPDAAQSEWVNQEIAYWRTNRDPSRILPVVTDGEFSWAGGDVTGDAVPDTLKGAFGAEPRWVDLRFAKGEEHLDLKHPRFLAAVADIASAVRGVPKDELESEEVKQHHRTIRTAWAGGIVVLLLAVTATVFGIQSANNARRATAEAERANANAALATAEAERANANAAFATARELALNSGAIADDDPELGILLALESIATTDAVDVEPLPESLSALWHSFTRNRVELAIPGAGNQEAEFSPDGTILATDMESDRSAVVFWDPSTGDEVGRLPGPDLPGLDPDIPRHEFVTDIVFDENFVYVARSWPADFQLDLVPVVVAYDVDRLQEVTSFLGPPGGDYVLMDVSERGDVSALVGPEGPATIWPADDPGNPVVLAQDAFEFLGDGSLVIGLRDRTDITSPMVVVNWQSGTELREFDIPALSDNEDRVAALSPDQTRVAVGGFRSLVGVFDVETGAAVFPPRPYSDPQVITWSEDGTRIALSGNDADVTIIDAETGEIDLVLSGHDASVFSTAWHPSGEKLASIAFDNEDTRIWDVRPEGPDSRGFIAVRGDGVLGVLDGNGRLLYNAFGIGADLIDPETGTVESFDLAVGFPDIPLVSEDGTFVAGRDHTGAGVIVDVESGETTPLHECALPRGISWDGTYVAVESDCDREEFSAGVIELATGEHIIDLGDQPLGLADFTHRVGARNQEYVAFVVPSSNFLAGQEPDELQLWALDPLEQVFSLEHTQIGNLFLFPRFSHDGRYLGVGTNGGRAAVIDVEVALSGAAAADYIVFSREGHSGNVPTAIPSDSGLVATGGLEGFYRIWDIETGERVMEIDVRGEQTPISSLGWSPDGSTLYYQHDLRVIGRLPIDPAEMIELAESVVTRSLTDDECGQYLHTEGCG
jgi:WD40 repeat protein